MAIEMCDISGPVAHPRLSEAEYFSPEQVIPFPSEESTIGLVRIFSPKLRFSFNNVNIQVTSNVIGILIRLILKCDSRTNGHALLDMQGERLGLANDALTSTNRTLVFNRLALATAMVARALHLLEDTGSEHMLLDTNTVSATDITLLDNAISAARALASRADGLLLDGKLQLIPVVKVAQRHRNPHFHVRPAPLAAAAKVPAAAEESAEQVEGIVMPAPASPSLVLL